MWLALKGKVSSKEVNTFVDLGATLMVHDTGWIVYAIAAIGVALGVMLASVLVRVGSVRHVDFILSLVVAAVLMGGSLLFLGELARHSRIMTVNVTAAQMQRKMAEFLVRSAQVGVVSESEACINLATGAFRRELSHPDCQVGTSGVNLRHGTPTAEETSVWYLVSADERARWQYVFTGDFAELRFEGRAGCAVRYAPAPLPGMPALVSFDVAGC